MQAYDRMGVRKIVVVGKSVVVADPENDDRDCGFFKRN